MGDDSNLLVSESEKFALVKLIGRGTFKNSAPFKEFIEYAGVSKGKCLVLDMTDCVNLDSTFMGIVAGISGHYSIKSLPKPILINVSEKTRDNLCHLGVASVVNMMTLSECPEEIRNLVEETPVADELELKDLDKLSQAEMMLEAHEKLVEIHEKNVSEFQDVLDYLRKRVESQ